MDKVKEISELEVATIQIEKLKVEVEEKDRKIEELRKSKVELQDVIGQVLLKIEKADLIIWDWIEEYGFSEKPDSWAAVKYSSKLPDEKDIHGSNSLKWFYEYNRIFKLIDIASDYVLESRKALDEALK